MRGKLNADNEFAKALREHSSAAILLQRPSLEKTDLFVLTARHEPKLVRCDLILPAQSAGEKVGIGFVDRGLPKETLVEGGVELAVEEKGADRLERLCSLTSGENNPNPIRGLPQEAAREVGEDQLLSSRSCDLTVDPKEQ